MDAKAMTLCWQRRPDDFRIRIDQAQVRVPQQQRESTEFISEAGYSSTQSNPAVSLSHQRDQKEETMQPWPGCFLLLAAHHASESEMKTLSATTSLPAGSGDASRFADRSPVSSWSDLIGAGARMMKDGSKSTCESTDQFPGIPSALSACQVGIIAYPIGSAEVRRTPAPTLNSGHMLQDTGPVSAS